MLILKYLTCAHLTGLVAFINTVTSYFNKAIHRMSRFLELTIIMVAILVLIVPFCLTGLAVFVHLGRPIFFQQLRAGKTKSQFIIYKFRTMTDAVDEYGSPLSDDLRQTKFTRFIRRVKLDELPQIYAILKGDMALVGPRPLYLKTITEFGELGEQRCLVRPGLTGWSQISGSSKLNNLDKFKLDLWYVGHRTLLLDLRIILETVLVVIIGERVRKDRISDADTWLSDNGAGIIVPDPK